MNKHCFLFCRTEIKQKMKNFSCGYCKIELPSKSDLKDHLFKTHPKSKTKQDQKEIKKSYKCEKCTKELIL